MKGESRTLKSVKNVEVSIFYYGILLILKFWSRKAFLDYLGVEVLGLTTTAGNLLSYLNLAELGVGTAVTYFLYKPLNGNDYTTIKKIVALQGWIYRRVASVVIIGAVILMFFFPWIFSNIKVPLWYAYSVFCVMLFNAMLGYFLNYKTIVLNADQKGYKITIVTKGFETIICILQIALFPVVADPFVFYISTVLVSSVFECFWLCHVVNKEYPWLDVEAFSGRKLLKEFPDVVKKTGQVFVHKASTVLFYTVNPIMLYAFSDLSTVGSYSNYMVVIGQVHIIIGTIFSSIISAVGSLVATGDRPRIIRVFWELYDSRLCISVIAVLCLFALTQPFITLWIGKNYLLEQSFLTIILIDTLMRLMRTTVDHYITGYGLFQDVWAPLAEGAINIVGAICFGYAFGFNGVLLGSILSQALIIFLWKPYMLFRKGIGIKASAYFIPVLKRYILVVVDILLFCVLNSRAPESLDHYAAFGGYALIVFVISVILVSGEFYLFSQGFRDFGNRIHVLVRNAWSQRYQS